MFDFVTDIVKTGAKVVGNVLGGGSSGGGGGGGSSAFMSRPDAFLMDMMEPELSDGVEKAGTQSMLYNDKWGLAKEWARILGEDY